MIIDCERCEVRDVACGECVVGVLLGMPGVPARQVDGPPGASEVQLDAPERRALEVLADQGLVPRLRLVAGVPRATPAPGPGPREVRDAG